MDGAGKTTRLFDALLGIGAALSGGLMIGVMLVVCLKVVFRYVLGFGWIGVDQMSGIMLLYITFLGAAWVLSRDEHVTVDVVLIYLPHPVQRTLIIANSVICAAVCLLVCVYAVLEVHDSLRRGVLVAAELVVPRAIYLAVIPVGFLFLWIQFIRRAWRAYHDRFVIQQKP
jgi:TRAP-type C4-dicarboxylate transport system permease small subunit